MENAPPPYWEIYREQHPVPSAPPLKDVRTGSDTDTEPNPSRRDVRTGSETDSEWEHLSYSHVPTPTRPRPKPIIKKPVKKRVLVFVKFVLTQVALLCFGILLTGLAGFVINICVKIFFVCSAIYIVLLCVLSIMIWLKIKCFG